MQFRSFQLKQTSNLKKENVGETLPNNEIKMYGTKQLKEVLLSFEVVVVSGIDRLMFDFF